MNNIYPQYSSKVGFLVIGTDPTSEADKIASYSDREGFAWPMVVHNADILKEFRILERSTKIGIGRDGLIKFRKGFGLNSEETWGILLETLSGP